MCIACGTAWRICPEVFELDYKRKVNKIREEYLVKKMGNRFIGIIPDELYERVREAAESCPAKAISLEPKYEPP